MRKVMSYLPMSKKVQAFLRVKSFMKNCNSNEDGFVALNTTFISINIKTQTLIQSVSTFMTIIE